MTYRALVGLRHARVTRTGLKLNVKLGIEVSRLALLGRAGLALVKWLATKEIGFVTCLHGYSCACPPKRSFALPLDADGNGN